MTRPIAVERELTEDEFYAEFNPIPSPSGSDIWDRSELVINGHAMYPDNQVWSFVPDDVDMAMAGWATVNLAGYFVTDKPWTTGLESVLLCDCPAHQYIGRECTCTCVHTK